MKKVLFLFALILPLHATYSQKVSEQNFKSSFDRFGVSGCFVLFNQSDKEYIRYNSSYCDTGYIPASTFKIPNALITLEEGIIMDTTQIIKWDGQVWPVETWNNDQTLKSAMKYSCVWVFSEFASKIGIDKYYEYAESFNYGNKILTGQSNRFWLAGLLRISANQQIEFLEKFYNYKLPVSRRSVDIVKDIIVLEQTGTYKLSGKTGGGMISDKDYIMWQVGYLEKINKTYFFAMNFISDDFEKTSQARSKITLDILKQLELID